MDPVTLKLKTLKFSKILLEYDEPLIAIAVDDEGEKYIAMAVSDPKYQNPYLVAKIDDSHLEKVSNGTLDVLNAFLSPLERKWYVLDNNGMVEIADDSTTIPANYLPGEDLYV